MDTDTGLQERVEDILSQVGGIQLAYLFGSRACGEAGLYSDLDLAILPVEPSTAEDLVMQIVYRLHALAGFSGPIDGVDLCTAPLELCYNIIAHGVCVFKVDEYTRVEYEAGVMSRYMDYLPVLRQQRRMILSEESNERRVQRYRKAFERTQRTLGKINPASK